MTETVITPEAVEVAQTTPRGAKLKLAATFVAVVAVAIGAEAAAKKLLPRKSDDTNVSTETVTV